MESVSVTSGRIADFGERIGDIIQQHPADFLDRLREVMRDSGQLLEEIPARQRNGAADKYSRHILYADPLKRFTVMALAWRQGQFSPVHGHWTWCTYSVLQGNMEEEHFRWDTRTEVADLSGRVVRSKGCVVSAPAGLENIHRLGNAEPVTAISVHVYGVGEQDASTRVNRVLRTQSA